MRRSRTGVGFALERADLILTLRGVTLGVMRLLLPPVALIALAFLVSACFQGLGPLWETDHASMILLAWAVLMILLLNAVYQDGSDPTPFSKPIIRLIEVAFVALPLFGVFALYGLSLRIEQHGLTVVRTYGMIVASFIAVYCFGYAYAVVRRSPAWLAGIQPINRSIALFVLAVILLLQLPWLDPFRLSADNQFHRVADGRVPISEFDFGYVKFELGHEGREAIDKLRGLATHPQRAELEAALARLDRYEDRYQWLLAQQQMALSLSSDDTAAGRACRIDSSVEANELACAGGTCFVFPIKLTPDGPGELSACWYLARRTRSPLLRADRTALGAGLGAIHQQRICRRGGTASRGRRRTTTPLLRPSTPDLRVGHNSVPFRATARATATAPPPNGSTQSPRPVDRNTAPTPPP